MNGSNAMPGRIGVVPGVVAARVDANESLEAHVSVRSDEERHSRIELPEPATVGDRHLRLDQAISRGEEHANRQREAVHAIVARDQHAHDPCGLEQWIPALHTDRAIVEGIAPRLRGDIVHVVRVALDSPANPSEGRAGHRAADGDGVTADVDAGPEEQVGVDHDDIALDRARQVRIAPDDEERRRDGAVAWELELAGTSDDDVLLRCRFANDQAGIALRTAPDGHILRDGQRWCHERHHPCGDRGKKAGVPHVATRFRKFRSSCFPF